MQEVAITGAGRRLLMLTGRAEGYWRERRGRNMAQARVPMTASSSHGENRTCTAKLRTVRATMAMRTRAMIASMVIGLHCWRSGRADVLRLPPPTARVDRGHPRFDPEMRPASLRVNPGHYGHPRTRAGTGRVGAGGVAPLCSAPPTQTTQALAEPPKLWAALERGLIAVVAAHNGAFCCSWRVPGIISLAVRVGCPDDAPSQGRPPVDAVGSAWLSA
jgi:hypothetical protein